MKQGKNPTRVQSILIKSYRFDPNNWFVIKNLPGELHLVHRHTDSQRILKK